MCTHTQYKRFFGRSRSLLEREATPPTHDAVVAFEAKNCTFTRQIQTSPPASPDRTIWRQKHKEPVLKGCFRRGSPIKSGKVLILKYPPFHGRIQDFLLWLYIALLLLFYMRCHDDDINTSTATCIYDDSLGLHSCFYPLKCAQAGPSCWAQHSPMCVPVCARGHSTFFLRSSV